MGIRSRLKGRLKKLAGADAPVEPTPRREAPPPRKPTPTPPPVAKTPPAARPTPATDATDAKRPVDEAKVRRHREKAQRGVLKHLDKEGGTLGMKELHDFSERRYFIAHAGFSKMMEFFVEYRYVDFDHDAHVFQLTDDGRHYMGSPVK